MVPSCKGDVAQTKQHKARRTQVVPLDFGIERVQQANCFPVPTTPGTAALRVNIWSPIGKPERLFHSSSPLQKQIPGCPSRLQNLTAGNLST